MGVVGVAVAVVIGVAQLRQGDTGPGSDATPSLEAPRLGPSASSDVVDPPAGASDLPETPGGAKGTVCLGETGQAVDCLTPHRAQAFVTDGACDEAALGEFISIRAGDVVRPDLTIAAQEDRCTVALEGGELTGDLAGSFGAAGSGAADQLRYCLDRDFAPALCGEPHHGEVVGAGSSADCTTVAAAYLGIQGTNFPRELEVLARDANCVVVVKGENALTRSLRGLGQRTLPIAALR